MKNVATVALIALCCIAFATAAFAESRQHPFEEFYFGDSFHKSPAGIHMNYLKVQWDDNGLKQLDVTISAWKGKLVWEDVYFIAEKNGKKGIIYKLSQNYKLGNEYCYLECPYKKTDEKIFFNPQRGPFDSDTGEIWFVFKHGGQAYYVVWEMKSNAMAWYKSQDKAAPPVLK